MGCPAKRLSAIPGLKLERRGLYTYLILWEAVLASGSLFHRYLMSPGARQVFGATHALYRRTCIAYDSQGRPTGVGYFSTRLLLAFLEVQLALGFSGHLFDRHQKSLESILAGRPAELQTNYYHRFTHQNNIGIHYVYGPEQKGSGYAATDWSAFMHYSECAMRRAYELSPADFAGTEEGLARALGQHPGILASAYARNNSISVVAMREWGRTIARILRTRAPEGASIPCLATGVSLPYIPFIDCLLDMPYRDGAIVVFQSVCGSR